MGSLFLWAQTTYNDVVLFAASFPLQNPTGWPSMGRRHRCAPHHLGLFLLSFCIPNPWPCPSPSPTLSQLLQHSTAPQRRRATDLTCLARTSSCTVPHRLLCSWNNKIYHLWQTGCLSEFGDCSCFSQRLAQAEPRELLSLDHPANTCGVRALDFHSFIPHICAWLSLRRLLFGQSSTCRPPTCTFCHNKCGVQDRGGADDASVSLAQGSSDGMSTGSAIPAWCAGAGAAQAVFTGQRGRPWVKAKEIQQKRTSQDSHFLLFQPLSSFE